MASLGGRKLDQICDAVYEAAAIPERWPDALAKLAWGVDAVSGHFAMWNKAAGRAEFAVTARADRASEQTYSSHYGAIDPSRQLLEHQLAGAWIANHQLFSEAFMAEHPYYREFLIPLGFRFTTKCRVYDDRESNCYGVFGFVRREGADPFEGGPLDEIAAILTPHLGRAAKLHQKLAPARIRGRLIESAFDRLACGLVIAGCDGRVLAINKAALDILDGDNGLALREGSLQARNPDENYILKKLCRGPRGAGSLRIARGARPPLTLTIAPLVESAELSTLAGDRGSMILISDPETRASPELTAVLRQLFGLSPAEARLACLLERGLSLADAARTLRVSDSTVRSQLKQVFAKMNVSRQSELASTIMDLDRIRPVPPEM